MITEPAQCLILHCNRCNAPFTDDFDGDDRPIHWTTEALADTFPQHMTDDACGWIRIDERYLCRKCWDWSDTDDPDDSAPFELPELPAAEAAKVTRAQASYGTLAPRQAKPAFLTREALLALLDDIRARVAISDSWEGHLEYLIPDDDTGADCDADFAVRAGYRTGSTMGQGGYRLIEGES